MSVLAVRNLRVTVFTTNFPDPSIGQASERNSNALMELFSDIDLHGVEINCIIVPWPKYNWRKMKVNSNKNYKFEQFSVYKQVVANFPKTLFIFTNDTKVRLAKLLGDTDLLLSHMPYGGIAASKASKLFRIPHIHVVHGTDLLDVSLLKKYSRNCASIFCRSLAIEKQMNIEGMETSGVVFSGLSKELFDSIENVEKKIISGEKCLKVLSVCTLEKLKNLDVVLEALSYIKENKNWHYTIIGDGPEELKLKEFAKDLGIIDRVTIKGRLPRLDCIKAMRESDIFVMPSAPETFGLVYLEAMASGCQTIGAKGWGIDGVIQNGKNGWLVEPRSVVALFQIFKKIVGQDHRIICLRGFETASNYTKQKATKNYAELIHKAWNKLK